VVRAVVELADRAGQVEDAAAVPAFPEGVLEVVHGRPAHLGLDVVPGRAGAVDPGELHHLRVAGMRGVVVAAVAEVDAAHERDVTGRASGVAQHDQFLVVTAAAPGPGIEQDLAAVVVDLPDELGVGRLGLVQCLGLRAPQKPEDPDPAARGAAQHLADLGPRAVEALVQVAAEIQEVDLVARLGGLELSAQPGEVTVPVHQRLDQVAGGERPEVGSQVGPVALGQEPRRYGRVAGQMIRSVLFQRVARRIGGIGKHVRIVASPEADVRSKSPPRAGRIAGHAGRAAGHLGGRPAGGRIGGIGGTGWRRGPDQSAGTESTAYAIA
jgi:hypothetical protein